MIGEHSPLHQFWSDGDIKHTTTVLVELFGHGEDLIRPTTHPYRLPNRPLIELRNLAVGVMKTHQPVHPFDRCKSSCNGDFGLGGSGTCHTHFNEGAQERPATSGFRI